ncbi:LANO_0D10220g1_1 [Lachancea nothofagi CBS 11611]|uniref:LANO_0D10220g1_1 n=1 Tax=Lachancea nothofagi CBS 11611 TaxID=1266666 RepID=A0A1G4JK40_9SACH|nr:LANO_0D10220g1_1 [Lachancea nothofagi CBS 11611]
MRGYISRASSFGLKSRIRPRNQLLQTVTSRFVNTEASTKRRNPYLTSRPIDRVKSVMSTGNSKEATVESKDISKPIVWVDCEMTGLDHTKDNIIEICCIITDGDLNIVDEEGYESVVHCDKEILEGMDEWCVDHHGSSGLTQKVLESSKTTQQVEDELLAYVQKYIPTERKGVLAGNTVHMDRLFMLREFPKVVKHLFYRIIDVSTIMEVSFRHNSELASVFPRKKGAHTARADILESIAQLKWYREHYLKSTDETKEFVTKRRAEMEKDNGDNGGQDNGDSGVSGVFNAVKESALQAASSLKAAASEAASALRNDEKEGSSAKKQRVE